MLQGEHSAIRLTFIKLPFVIKIVVLSIVEWLFYTGFFFLFDLIFNVSVNNLSIMSGRVFIVDRDLTSLFNLTENSLNQNKH